VKRARGFADRRALLRAAAALGLNGALPACARPRRTIAGGIVDDALELGHRLRDGTLPKSASEERRVPVVIAGGGVAGLSAAWRLARAGFDDFVVLELAAEVGGTARGGVLSGLAHPWGAHYLPVPHARQRALVRLLEELDLARGFGPDGRLLVPDAARVRAPEERLFALGFWQEGLWLADGASARDREELARFEAAVRARLAPDPDGRAPFELPVAHSGASARALDSQDAASYAAALGLTGERIRWYLEYATRDDFGCALEETSAWALLHYFAARVGGEERGSDFLTWPEGNAFLVRALARAAEGRIAIGQAVLEARAASGGCEITVHDAARGRTVLHRAEHAILALPQFVAARVLAEDPARAARASFRYGSWVVANLHLERLPASRGFPNAWDNVFYDSPSLGYVDATHQLDRAAPERVWTWYLPLLGSDERESRARLLAEPYEHWRELCLADLCLAHPDVVECVTRLDVWRHGHAMVKPVPGFLWGGAREEAARPIGALHFAHADLGGMALFEEAHWAGVRAAEEVLSARKIEHESWL
jgi:phytoene dehydrogenase-like protein